MSDIIFLSDVRLSFPALIEPKKNKTDPSKVPTYEADFIMPPNHPGFGQIMQTYAAMAQEKWKAHANQIMQMINADRKIRCFAQGSERIDKTTLKIYDGYEGMVAIGASKKSDKGAPQMIKPDGSAVDPMNTMEYQAHARKMYGGCRVNAAIKLWLQENTHGRGVRCDLIAVQFLRDDKPFGDAQPDATPMFGAVAAGAAPANPFGAPAAAGGMPGFFGATPAASPAMPAPPTFGAPAQMPSFFGR